MSQYWPFSGLTRYGAMRERLIVSLDLGGWREALKMVDQLGRLVGMFKIGKQLFISGGPDFVREVRRRGAEVFLDLKFQDTPRALMRTALEATRLGVRMFDVHLNGHAESIGRVRAEIDRLCQNEGLRKPHIVAVAMLMGVTREGAGNGSVDGIDGMVELARHAATAGLDGVFTSAQGAPRIRGMCGRRFIIVTPLPCVRDGASEFVDGAAAIQAGADFLVVGSPSGRPASRCARCARSSIKSTGSFAAGLPTVRCRSSRAIVKGVEGSESHNMFMKPLPNGQSGILVGAVREPPAATLQERKILAIELSLRVVRERPLHGKSEAELKETINVTA